MTGQQTQGNGPRRTKKQIERAEEKPRARAIQADAIPAILTARPQWVGWQFRRAKGKWTKVPIDCHNGSQAAVNRPTTWVSFDDAMRYYGGGRCDGIGFVFTRDDPFAGVDFDDCYDSDNATLEPWAAEAVARLDTYTEISPTGTGVKAFVVGRLTAPGNRRGRIEMYDRARFFAVTEGKLPGCPGNVTSRQEELEALHAEWIANPSGDHDDIDRWETGYHPRLTVRAGRTLDPANDADLIEIAGNAADGDKFKRLWGGDTTEHRSASEADLALCNLFAFYAGHDPDRIDRLFRQSGLMREKWERQDYRNRTIGKALEGRTEFYGAPSCNGTLPDGEHGDAWEEAEDAPAWPAPPSPEAYHGMAGDVVRQIGPHTEADPVAILIQFLVAFGSVIGRAPHYKVEARNHHANLYAVLVGRTAKGRKGTALSWVEALFKDVADSTWADHCQQTGLSSGEGLVAAVRDPVTRIDNEGNEQVVEEGAKDKRLLVVEEEFSSVLRVAARDGNTLSAIIRQAWDTGRLHTMTRRSPLKATGAHISIIGHITREELARLLSQTDAANGFANRFLWFCVKRSKLLPDGGGTVDLEPLQRRLRAAVNYAREAGRLLRDTECARLWRETYGHLSREMPGVLGLVTSRAEAQVLRLSCLYALLDCTQTVRVEHLKAAVALWDYAERSCMYVFGETGNADADQLLHALRKAGEMGLSLTQINQFFGRHKKADDIKRILAILESQGRVISGKPAVGGQPAQNWKVSKAAKAAKAANAMNGQGFTANNACESCSP